MNIGFVGTGAIASSMAKTLENLKDIKKYAVASRDIKKAEKFKENFNFSKAYGCYEDLIKDKNVDLVYIATVHSTHYPVMLQCLKYDKPVLCEKCFTTSLKDTMDIYDKFEKKHLFVTEALWTSFMPSRKIINDLLFKEKAVGEIKSVEANFILPIENIERIKRRDLGGGSAMDLGVYPVSFVFRTLGFNYLSFRTENLQVNEFGADVHENVIFSYDGGVTAICNIDCCAEPNTKVIINGDKGKIELTHVTCPEKADIFNETNEIIRSITFENKYGGLEHEVIACKKAIESNKIECEEWTHENSIEVAKIIETIVNR